MSDAASGVQRAEMNAAFGLAASAPASGARILAGPDRRGARYASDRRIALGDERMARQFVPVEISEEHRRVPSGERIDLDAIAFGLEQGERGARRALVSLASGDPGLEGRERLGERVDLADAAAAIGVVRP